MLFGFIALVVIVVALDMLNWLQGDKGWQPLVIASVVAGLLAGVPARGFWKGGLAAVVPAVFGCAVLTLLGNRVSQSVSGGPFLELSAWGSFVEMLTRGAGTAAVIGGAAGYVWGRLKNGHKTGSTT
jgi:hypothetical protein